MAFTGKGGLISFNGTEVSEINTWSFSFAPADAVEFSTFSGKFSVPGPPGAPTGSFTCYSAPPYLDCPAAITLSAGGTNACDASAESVVVTGSAFMTGYSLEAPADGIVQFSIEFAFTATPNIAQA